MHILKSLGQKYFLRNLFLNSMFLSNLFIFFKPMHLNNRIKMTNITIGKDSFQQNPELQMRATSMSSVKMLTVLTFVWHTLWLYKNELSLIMPLKYEIVHCLMLIAMTSFADPLFFFIEIYAIYMMITSSVIFGIKNT